MNKLLLKLSALAYMGSLISCHRDDPAQPKDPKLPTPPTPQASAAPNTTTSKPQTEVAKELLPELKQVEVFTEHLGDFGSDEPIERTDLPQRGIISFKPEPREKVFRVGEHWEQYDFPFQAKRWGRYKVKISYILKNAGLGVQVKLANQRIKKQLKSTAGSVVETYLGEIQIESAGDNFISLYTPGGVGFSTFYLKEITLIPTFATPEVNVNQTTEGALELLAKHAITWSETMRYEPKTEKNCLGFWSDVQDFAEWEFEVTKPGTFAVNVHQGCGNEGGSKVNILFQDTTLPFTVKETGGYQNWQVVDAGKIEISKPGRYRLSVKPETKVGPAVMDIQKIVLKPVS